MAESFNSWIGDARGKPVVDLIDMIRGMLMEQRAERKMNSSSWRSDVVPHIEEYIREISTRKEHFIIRHCALHKGEVEGRHEREVVDIEQRECTCRYWQMTGLPCIHAIALIGSKEHPLWHSYVDDYYHVNRYRMAYEGAIAALPGKEQWQMADDCDEIGIPNTLRPRGRPRKNRFKNFLESNIKKTTNVHKCSRCGIWGNHRNTCKNPLNRSSQVTPEADLLTSQPPSAGPTSNRSKLAIRRGEMASTPQE